MTSYKCVTGSYIQSHYKVWVNKRLKYAPYAQAGVLEKDGLRVLISYITPVLIEKDGILYCTGLYSNTTRRHISAFLREYYPNISYYDIKAIAPLCAGIDCITGEQFDAHIIAADWYRGLFAPTYYKA